MKNLRTNYGDWALITGGSSGIGAALARQCAESGMNLVLVARSQAKLETQAQQLREEFGVEVRTISADLSVAQGTDAVTDGVDDLEIGLLVPCAAVESSGYFVDDALDRHQALIQMNVVAPTVLAHHFGRNMAKRGRGAILLVSSLSGWMAQPYMASYGATKAYILSLGESLHQELKGAGVDVAVLSPGPTDTPMAAATGIDFKKMGMSIMTPAAVAARGLASLGKGPNAIPGFRNRMMVFMMTRLMPRRLVGFVFKKMMGKALGMAKRPAVADVAMAAASPQSTAA